MEFWLKDRCYMVNVEAPDLRAATFDEAFGPKPIPDYAMRVGPGTDAVVWKLCDTTETNEL